MEPVSSHDGHSWNFLSHKFCGIFYIELIWKHKKEYNSSKKYVYGSSAGCCSSVFV